MSELVFLGTQLEKAGWKTKQPEARKPFGSIDETLTFIEEHMNAHRGTLSFFGLLPQLLVSLDKTSHVLTGKWEMTI